jgi:multiple sugar transport system substrate-binding protein
MKIRTITVIQLLLIAVMIVSACSFSNAKEKVPKENVTLKVLYYNADSFQYEYGFLLAALYPDYEFDVVGTNTLYADHDSEETFDYETALYELIEKEKPDIMLLKTEQFMKLAGENKLLNLEPFVRQANYNVEGIVPNLLEYLREIGHGRLYGLANSFNSRALYYNKDLFDQYQIPYPTDRMTWEELFQLAMRFPAASADGERIYGLQVSESGNLFDLGYWLGHTEGLSLIDPAAKQITIRSESWENVFQQAMNAIDSGRLYADHGPAGASASVGVSTGVVNPGGGAIKIIEITEEADPFITGKIAMSLDYSSMIQRIRQAQEQSKNKDSIIKNWDIVTVPVGKQAPDRNPHMTIRDIFAIGADSPNKDAAWEVLSYITGDNYAKAKSKTSSSGLSTRTAYLRDEEGHNYEAFYSLKPSSYDLPYGDPQMLPKDFIVKFEATARKEFERVMNQEVTLADALTELERWANMALLAE